MTKVVYLGPQGSFTHQACLMQYDGDPIDKQSIEEIFSSVEGGEADLGVLPIENSNEGVVTHSLDCLMHSSLKIVQEIELNVKHNLYVNSQDKPIHYIYSHPQAFAQCKAYLHTHYPNAKLVLAASTSQAIKRMMQDEHAAAIAGPHVVEYYDLHLIQSEIQDNPLNVTRFLVIGRQSPLPTQQDKTSIMLALGDTPGTLVNLLSPFSLLNINLTKIESRPIGHKKWVNVFFLDLQGHIEDKRIQMALNLLETMGVHVKHLGSYPQSQGVF